MFDLRLQNYEENVPKCDTSEKNVKKTMMMPQKHHHRKYLVVIYDESDCFS